MKRDQIVSFIFYFHSFLVLCCGGVVTQNVSPNLAVNKFQNNVQQQNFYTILNSIEERLRNLDNIYSMQLSQTLENKLDQYSRKLESLDTKIIRLEALVMMNLDKISENISTKNFKDDISKTNTYRKMDSLYEGLSHRLSYMDRKYETSFEKLQEKIDITMNHLSKIDGNLATRGSDIEMELSDAIFAIDDLKNTYSIMEGRIQNISESTMNMTKDNYDLIKRFNMDNKKAMNMLHDNIIGNLQYMDNKTSQHIKISQENTDILKGMKTELKEDFNNYANKVADMNSDIWKSTDTTEGDLHMIASVINSTKVELQNGMRSLMLQIGKISNKGAENDTSADIGVDHYNELDKKLSKNFEKILMNQDVFMDSCHRLQMDEAQIETEISVMLEKLIDMLEKKLAAETKDMKSIEKALKTHDSRVNRNLHQANSNIISLFEKYTLNNQQMVGDMKQIQNDINTLYAFVQMNSNKSRSSTDKNILEKLDEISKATRVLSEKQEKDTKSLKNIFNSLDNITNAIHSQYLPKYKQSKGLHEPTNQTNLNVQNSINTTISELDEDTQKAIDDIFGSDVKNNSLNEIDEDTQKAVDNIFIKPQVNNNSFNDIDEDTQKAIDNIFRPSVTNNSLTEIDEDTRKAIDDIFGPNSNNISADTNNQKVTVKQSTNCTLNYGDLIDLRGDIPKECQGKKKNKIRKRKNKKNSFRQLIDLRSEFSEEDEDIEDEDYEEGTTEESDSATISEENTIFNEYETTSQIPLEATHVYSADN